MGDQNQLYFITWDSKHLASTPGILNWLHLGHFPTKTWLTDVCADCVFLLAMSFSDRVVVVVAPVYVPFIFILHTQQFSPANELLNLASTIWSHMQDLLKLGDVFSCINSNGNNHGMND